MTVIIILVGGGLAFIFVTQDYDISYEFYHRFVSLEGFMSSRSTRIEMALNGLSILHPHEWLFGAGLTSVLVSGPHNDYIRWLQRVGLPLMIFGFMPFFITFRESFLLVRSRLTPFNRQDNSLLIFLTLSGGFTLFHSFFGYPREEANQAVAVYMGLALWFGAYREGLMAVTEGLNQPEQVPALKGQAVKSPQELL